MRAARILVIVPVVVMCLAGSGLLADSPGWLPDSVEGLETELLEKYGADQQMRIQQGLQQVADFWREEDGDRQV